MSWGVRGVMFITRGKVWEAIHGKAVIEAVNLDTRQAWVLDRRWAWPGSLYREEETNCHQQ